MPEADGNFNVGGNLKVSGDPNQLSLGYQDDRVKVEEPVRISH
jgi:hypothetical protein